jgi:uncharacterized protein
MFFMDPLYLLIFGITLVISLAAQMYIKSAYGKWSKVANSHNLTGLQVGQELLRDTDLGATYQMSKGTGVQFQGVGGNLTDHYDPRTHTVGLSQGVATQPSVASMAIVAHELGHAQQYAAKSPLIAARSFLLPAVRVSPMISYGLIMMVGFIFNLVGAIYIGILFFGITVLFSVLTLPVEFDASRRGLNCWRRRPDDQPAGRKGRTDGAARRRRHLRRRHQPRGILQLLYYLALANRRR